MLAKDFHHSHFTPVIKKQKKSKSTATFFWPSKLADGQINFAMLPKKRRFFK